MANPVVWFEVTGRDGAGLRSFYGQPVMTEAMHEVEPALAGAASGILNTTRQLGSAVGLAVIGAVLQNQLSSALHDRAVADSAQLPPQVRQDFVNGFANAVKGGLQVGRGQSGGSAIPAGLPPGVVSQMQHLIHDVFVGGFTTAMRPTLGVVVAAVVVGALSCVLIARRLAVSAVPDERDVRVAEETSR